MSHNEQHKSGSIEQHLKKMEELCDQATPGPWHIGHVGEGGEYSASIEHYPWDICDVHQRRDEVFIAQSRSDMPKLLKALRRGVSALNSVCGCTDEQCDQCFALDEIEEILSGKDN